MKNSIVACTLLALAAGCGSNNDHGTLALLATDAPLPFEIVQSATVEIDRITIDEGPYSLEPVHVLYEGEPLSIELSGLRNGVVRHLFSRNVPVQVFRRMHLHFTGAELVLTNGHTFSSQDGTLTLPHESQGHEITIDNPVHVKNGHWSRLLVDFDLPSSFVSLSGENLQLAQTLHFQPLLHAVRPGATGEIRGVVTVADAGGELAPVASATVYFLPAGTESLTLAAGATGTDADGSFAKIGLPPGTYDVVAQKGSAAVTRNACLVNVGEYTVVDLSLP
jgi:Domain of unknown function (DUF4382)/Carboxypeptidase regulatory-like domain